MLVRPSMLLPLALFLVSPAAIAQTDNIGHTRHEHAHGEKHPRVVEEHRFMTNRAGRELQLPAGEEMFTFAIFGDRTGGPAEGVSVLADAVRDVNLLEPDLVMTVGDMIQGYNQRPGWLEQMREFRGIMDELLCPWFPVAGNHDVYWRGPDRPDREHEDAYEVHFGPLWYAFEHKKCWFVVLYTDEGNPATGERSISKAECQTMSPEQLAWLSSTLERTKDAPHVFVFVHHPRWIGGNYGNDWEKVHEVLVDAGNVSAVFGGHIHQMRYDPRDGIEYVALATTGGGQSGRIPDAGYLHHFNMVTVRENQIAMAALPVGEVLDVRELTPELRQDARRLADGVATFRGKLDVSVAGACSGEVEVLLRNPGGRAIDVTLVPESDDSRWMFWPDHAHAVIPAGGERVFPVRATREAGSMDEWFRMPEVAVSVDYLAEGFRYSIPERVTPMPVQASLPVPATPDVEHALRVDGRSGHVVVDAERLKMDLGSAFTLECWFRAERFGSRVGLVNKTENSEYGFFVSDGRPAFYAFIGRGYVELEPDDVKLERGRWYHIAGVYDGSEVRLYLDGRLIASQERSGRRRANALPLLVGADVDGAGRPMSYFAGWIDGVRLTERALYDGRQFEPPRRPAEVDGTRVLLNFDAPIGPWAFDETEPRMHPLVKGGASIEAPGR